MKMWEKGDTRWLWNYPWVARDQRYISNVIHVISGVGHISQTRNLLAPRTFHLSNVSFHFLFFFFFLIWYKVWIQLGSSGSVQKRSACNRSKKSDATRINQSRNLWRWECRIECVKKEFQVSHGFIITLTINFF